MDCHSRNLPELSVSASLLDSLTSFPLLLPASFALNEGTGRRSSLLERRRRLSETLREALNILEDEDLDFDLAMHPVTRRVTASAAAKNGYSSHVDRFSDSKGPKGGYRERQ